MSSPFGWLAVFPRLSSGAEQEGSLNLGDIWVRHDRDHRCGRAGESAQQTSSGGCGGPAIAALTRDSSAQGRVGSRARDSSHLRACRNLRARVLPLVQQCTQMDFHTGNWQKISGRGTPSPPSLLLWRPGSSSVGRWLSRADRRSRSWFACERMSPQAPGWTLRRCSAAIGK